MAAPLRPSVRNTNTERVYQSFDAIDQQLYNDLRFLYEKAAFLAFIEASGINLANGFTIQAEWNRHGATYVRDWRTRRRLLRPRNVADVPLPVPAVVPPPPPPPPVPVPALGAIAGNDPLPPVGPVIPQPTISQPTISQPTTPAAAQPQDADEADSPVTLVGGSPRFVLANDTDADRYVRLSPTRGQRAHVGEFLDSTNWKFVKVLYQTELDDERARQAINPIKSINLYVRKDIDGIIREQIVVKCIDVTLENELVSAENEVRMNATLEKIKCGHLLKTFGDSVRKTRKRLEPKGPGRAEEQTVIHTYSEFAQFGDLVKLASAHNSESVPVPEHFIWHFLSQMTEALLAFQTGTCEEPRSEESVAKGDAAPAAAGWEALLHSDIKLDNVFCCQENTVYPSYPRIVLADFDLAHSVRNLASRYVGTRTTQPPERNAFASDFPNEYAPDEWDISEKSDIWGIGVIAYLLLSAGSTQDSYARAEHRMATDAEAWVHDFATTNVENHPTGGLLTSEVYNFSDIHSLGLIRLVDQCLQYRPEARPTLEYMKYRIDANIERLDRMYGDEIKKNGKAVASGHRVLYGQNNKRQNEFAVGQRYKPPRKRRRTHLTAGQATEYRTLVDSWADTTRYPRPDSASQTDLVRTIDNTIGNSQDEKIARIYDDESLRRAYDYMLSCMRYRLDEDATFSWHSGWNYDLQESFNQKNRGRLLRRLHEFVVPELLNDSPAIELEHAIRAFEHALEWALFLLEKQNEPLTPVLDEKTEIHRALRDWVFVHPYSRAE